MDSQSKHSAEVHPSLQKIWTRDFLFVCLANFFIFLGFQMTLPTIPLFVEELGGNDFLIGLVVGIFTFSALLIRPWAGHALETKGRRFIYLLGLLIFVVSVSSFSIASSLFFLFALRIIQGAGWGLSTTAGGTVATDLIPVKRRGEGIGYFGLSGNIAMAFGPSVGLALVQILDFPKLFLICGGLGATAFILAAFMKYRPIDPNVEKPKKKWDVYEKAAIKPASLLLFITVTFGGIATFLPLYTKQNDIPGIELYFFFFAISLMLSRAFAGKIFDRRGLKAVFIPGTLLIVIAMLLLTFLVNQWMLILAAILYGVGFGSVQPALQAWAINSAPANRKGMANATFFSFFDLGVGFGAMFFGFISKWFGYSTIYACGAISVCLSILLYLFYARTKEAA
ncbi:MFS transporter [Pueribacillus theae]|uniref:MFS transporter n=1 Tax=Pueribacillus theae TaxID=2171751 RepID=A0A2U1K6F9_9BACI|nr:MFS transporter [Pueribacillus theae]PWA13107.1 MFS transporter [Pueribacillus theae]